MKSLVLKDFYNIAHNYKSMLFFVILWAAIFIPSSGIEGYVGVCAVLHSSMIITTFSFDDYSKWNRYAMIMPVSKKDIVLAKFVSLIAFCAGGAVLSLVIGVIGSTIAQKMVFEAGYIRYILMLLVGVVAVTECFGSMAIPMVFRFGAEKGRLIIMGTYLVPFGIGFGIYKLCQIIGITITDNVTRIVVYFLPVVILLWNYIMYRISLAILEKKEF